MRHPVRPILWLSFYREAAVKNVKFAPLRALFRVNYQMTRFNRKYREDRAISRDEDL